jgi:hypothetical protein
MFYKKQHMCYFYFEYNVIDIKNHRVQAFDSLGRLKINFVHIHASNYNLFIIYSGVYNQVLI